MSAQTRCGLENTPQGSCQHNDCHEKNTKRNVFRTLTNILPMLCFADSRGCILPFAGLFRRSYSLKLGQTCHEGKDGGQFAGKIFIINDLQINNGFLQSNPVAPGQTSSCEGLANPQMGPTPVTVSHGQSNHYQMGRLFAGSCVSD
jgi:hypothetical protein